jgi:hypothetical protein
MSIRLAYSPPEPTLGLKLLFLNIFCDSFGEMSVANGQAGVNRAL